MQFSPTAIPGAYMVDLERFEDKRGFFARTWSAQEFEARGLDANLVQCSIAFNRQEATVRGMHYQAPPHEETKLVRCTRGEIFDVILDLRPDSSTYKQWLSVTMTADNGRALYVPKGVAHGYQTLRDQTEVLYQMSDVYDQDCARGVRWNDAAFAIEWPIQTDIVISERDASYPDFNGTETDS